MTSSYCLSRFDRGSELVCRLIKEYDVFSSPFKLVISLFILRTVLKEILIFLLNIILTYPYVFELLKSNVPGFLKTFRN